jgi:hypothetical protein
VAFSEVYVDPSIAADSGTGTIGDPFGDLEYAVEQTTFDTTNGTRVNVKAGTAEVLAADLDTAMNNTVTTPAWVPSLTAPAVFRGYSSVAGDGGVGSIDCNSFSLFSSGKNYVYVIELEAYNSGTNNLISLGSYALVNRCKLHDCNGSYAASVSAGEISDCFIYDFDVFGISVGTGRELRNFVWDGDRVATVNLLVGNNVLCADNICRIDQAAGAGINVNHGSTVINNSVWAGNTAGGAGIYSNVGRQGIIVLGNLVEGFSGAGARGIDLSATSSVSLVGGNGVYNCTSDYVAAPVVMRDLGDNEVLTASPFNDAANGDFSPVDVGNVKEGALPQVIGGGFV